MTELDRRTVLAMLGASAVLAACSDKKKPGSSKASGSSGQSSSSSAPTTPTTFEMGGSPVAEADRFDESDIALAKSHYEGRWLGAWTDSRGGTGTGDLTIAVDTTARLLAITASFAGPLLGGAPPRDTTYQISIDTFSKNADTLSINSPQLGKVTIDPIAFRMTCTDIPNHPDIDTFAVAALVQDATATVVLTMDTTDHVAFAWAKDAARPAPPELGATVADTGFFQGDYAAGLITTAELATAFGRAASAPQPNGGARQSEPGLDTSNGRAESDDGNLVLQYTVYRGTDAATAKAYFDATTQASPVTGIGDAAHESVRQGGILQVLRGREVLEVTVLDLEGTHTAEQLSAIQQSVARAMVARMTG